MEKKYTIMFVCTGNTCRSPMAQVALEVLLGKRRPGMFDVISSGTHAADGFPATAYAAEAVKLWDGDLSSHRSQQLTPALIKKSDLVLAMTSEHLAEIRRLVPAAKAYSYLLKNFPEPSVNGEGVEDPIGQPLQRYNETFLEIGEYLGKHLPEIERRVDASFGA